MLALLRTILGDFDYLALQSANRVLGPVFFVSFVFFVFFVLLVLIPTFSLTYPHLEHVPGYYQRLLRRGEGRTGQEEGRNDPDGLGPPGIHFR